jgi:hypothetical protein
MTDNDSTLIALNRIVTNLVDYNNAIDKEWRRLEDINDRLEKSINHFNDTVDELYINTQEATEFHSKMFLKRFFEKILNEVSIIKRR